MDHISVITFCFRFSEIRTFYVTLCVTRVTVFARLDLEGKIIKRCLLPEGMGERRGRYLQMMVTRLFNPASVTCSHLKQMMRVIDEKKHIHTLKQHSRTASIAIFNSRVDSSLMNLLAKIQKQIRKKG